MTSYADAVLLLTMIFIWIVAGATIFCALGFLINWRFKRKYGDEYPDDWRKRGN